MRGFRLRSILYSERCAHICLASSQNSNVWRPSIHEPTLNLFSRYVSTVASKRRYHSSQVYVDVAGRDSCRFFAIGCWLFIYWCSEDPNEQFSPSRNRFLRQTPTSLDRFALRQPLWPDYSTSKWLLSTNKSFDSSTKAIPSLHVISLFVRDRQWNELPAKLKITWRHSNRPIRQRP